MPKHHIAGAAALLLATAPAAWAEIDSQTIWADWQDVATRFGGTMTAASENYAGGTLTLTDVSITFKSDGASGTASYGTFEMIERDDGTVLIEFPERMSSTSITTIEGEPVEQTTEFTNEGFDTVVSEEDGIRTYDIQNGTMTMVMDLPASEGADPGDFTMVLSGMTSIYRSGLGSDADAFDQTLAADGFTISATGQGDDDGETVDVDYALTGLTSHVAGVYGDAPTGPVMGLSDLGFTYGGDISHSGGTLSITGRNAQGPFSLQSTSGAGTLTFGLGDESLDYTITSTDIEAAMEAPGFPVPVSLSMAESTVGFALPLGETGVEKPFAFTLAARELMLDDSLWDLFDPTGQLPRDPATLVIDLDGSAVMDVDMFGDPVAMANLQGPPGNLETLTINQILLTLAGAELRGSGDLEFPEVTPVPEPVGTVELALDGGFALADKLVALGFIPSERAAFIKGMAGAVARTVGDDQLESTIEFTPGGGISANGLPLK